MEHGTSVLAKLRDACRMPHADVIYYTSEREAGSIPGGVYYGVLWCRTVALQAALSIHNILALGNSS